MEYRNTKLAVLEAKARDKALTEGVAQAKNYAGKLMVRFTYASNGQGIYAIDMLSAVEEEIAKYPSPIELWNLTFAAKNSWRDRFAAVPFEDRGGFFQGRYYQDIAIERVLAAIAVGQERILLTLATGTGKTFIAFQLAWKLFHSRWNLTDWKADSGPTRRPRILFLADRNILADQAYNAFSAFDDKALVRIDPADIRKKGKVPKNGSIFFTIFQTFMSGPGDSPYFGEYPPDFFDFIVIDECHRGGANDESNWRGILDYFSPAVQLGLTATPKRKDNVDTYAYFGEPVFIYSLKDGINDGYLTPFRVKQISTTLDEYVYTPDDKVIEGEVEAGKRYEEPDFNKIIEIKDREKKRVEIFMSLIDQREKTLVFCATQDHALAIRDLINQIKANTDPNYCHRVTANDGALGEQWLRDFQDNEKHIPTILTTSQKLSTGVDARNVRNIVLLRPVNSMIEFKQIIGRGTRLYDGKDYFTIYDFVKAHHYFSDPEWDGEPINPGVCERCNSFPCRCERNPPQSCDVCGKTPCTCPKEPCEKCRQRPCVCKKKAKVKLADGKSRLIQHIVVTSFWHPDGTPMSAQQFMETLFGKLPEFFKDESELRTLWSVPDTRRKLLEGLAEKGFGKDQMSEMQKIIDAERSDLFDVLAHVAYALQPLTRRERADQAMAVISENFSPKQKVFLDFVLSHYVALGVEELDQAKLSPLLKLKYHDSIPDAVADLGMPDEIGRIFNGFQRYLYNDLSANTSSLTSAGFEQIRTRFKMDPGTTIVYPRPVTGSVHQFMLPGRPPPSVPRGEDRKVRGAQWSKLIGLLFCLPTSKLATDEILGNLEYFHHRSKYFVDFFCVGYDDLGEQIEKDAIQDNHRTPPKLINGKWKFDEYTFNECRNTIQNDSKWTFSGETDLLLVTARRTAGGAIYLDYSSAIACNLEQMIKDKAITSVRGFFEQIFLFGEQYNGTNPVDAFSDKLGMRAGGNFLLELVLSLIGKPTRDQFMAARHLAVADISK